MQILKLAELIETPWRNGGGVTRGIATGVVSDRVAWTISRADVARDGAFSDFSGMERVLTVVSGGVMRLEGPDVAFDAVPWVPVRFDGGLPIVARLRDGPLTDLNLMFDPTLCSGDVVTRRGPGGQGASCPQRGLLAYHVLSGAPQVGAHAVGVGDTLFMEPADQAPVLGHGDAVLEIRLSYRDQSDAIRLRIAAR